MIGFEKLKILQMSPLGEIKECILSTGVGCVFLKEHFTLTVVNKNTVSYKIDFLIII